MAVTRSAAKTAAAHSAAKPVRDGVTLQMFLWESTDKRGKKMKGEQQAKSSNMLRAKLRPQGIQPRLVKPKPKRRFGTTGKAVPYKKTELFIRPIATRMKSGVQTVMAHTGRQSWRERGGLYVDFR